jgi:hypothetical protein
MSDAKKPKKATSKTAKTTKAAKKMKMKMKEMSQTHGKVEKPQETVATTLDQVWGDEGLARYKTLEDKEYRDSLQRMSLTDLQTEAQRIGLVPVDNREMLTGRLMREFRTHVQQYQAPPQPSDPKAYGDDVLRILKEGQ